MSRDYWWFDHEKNEPVMENISGIAGRQSSIRGQKKCDKNMDYRTLASWDPGRSYKKGEIVKHRVPYLLIFEAKDDNFDCEPMWPIPLNSPWQLKII
jgi:hypothetical protein